jgi:hypothetical protein
MKSTIALLAGMLTAGCATLATAGDKVDESLAADPQGVVLIENIRGSVEVRGWDQEKVAVKGELDDLSSGLRFEREGKVTTVHVQLPEHDINSGDGSDLRIDVPRGSRVEFKGVSSSVNVADTSGGITLRTVSGDVGIDNLQGSISIKTVSGNLGIERSAGNAQIKSVSGDLELSLASREVSLSTVSGDIELALGEFTSLGVNSVSGDLKIKGALGSGGQVEIKTVSGDCTLGLSGALDARVSVKTGPGGDIVNKLDDTAPESLFPAQAKLETTLGDGSGSISISTVTGDIRLEKK